MKVLLLFIWFEALFDKFEILNSFRILNQIHDGGFCLEFGLKFKIGFKAIKFKKWVFCHYLHGLDTFWQIQDFEFILICGSTSARRVCSLGRGPCKIPSSKLEEYIVLFVSFVLKKPGYPRTTVYDGIRCTKQKRSEGPQALKERKTINTIQNA